MLAAQLKRALGYGLVRTPAVRFFQPATRDLITVFVLHRVGVDRARRASISVESLRKMLAYLRRNSYQLMPLEEVVRSVRGSGPPHRKAVAFTVDDGYEDQATVAAPVFAEFDCPLTVFLTTGFLDGSVVPWWDAVHHVFEQSRHGRLELEVAGQAVRYSLSSDEERFQSEMDFLTRAKNVVDADRRKGIVALAQAAEVDLPDRPLPPNVPMTWDQARHLERSGVTFGPHTVSHPILSQLSDEESAQEIAASWRRLKEELDHPIPVFCYPNGRLVDFGTREMEMVAGLGLTGAVTVDEAQVRLGRGPSDPFAPYRLSRVPFPDSVLDALLWASGVERVQHAIQRWAA
jgi:peptidoglycan/xylan/chitin deacetylase (PgdA/CDA1 family)